MAIKEIIEGLLLAKKAYDSVSDIREKNKSKATEARSTFIDGISGAISTAKRLSFHKLAKGEI